MPISNMNRRAFIGTALTFGALCSIAPSEAIGVTSADVQAIKTKFDAMNDELDQAVDKYNAAQDAYAAATDKVKTYKSKIAEAQSKIDRLQTHLSTRATSMYRSGSMSYLDVLLGVGSFDDFATVWDTLNSLNEDDADLVAQTKTAKAELESAKEKLASEQAEAKAQLQTAESYKTTIEAKTATYKREYNNLSSSLKSQVARAQAAEAAAATTSGKAYSPSSGGGSSSGSSIPTNGSVVDYARSRIGCPYVWGASGPNSFDCSGLTMWCYRQIGISLPHYTESQYSCAKARLSVYSASAGDVLYRSGHVAIYAGGDSYIHAPHTGDHVRYASGIGSFSAALRF